MYQSLKAKLILLNKNLKKKLNNIPTIEEEYKLFNCYKQKALIALLKTELKAKEQECEEWKAKYYNSTTETKAELIKQNKIQENLIDKYKQALAAIERHFDKRCDVCREENGIEASCDVCWKKDIKDIINNTKEQ